VEFLVFERVSEPHHALYTKNLAALGIEATTRLVDPVQYRSRVQDFDYDITMNRMVFSLTPSDALRNYFSSKTADIKGSPNFAGIKDPVIDALIDKAGVATIARHSTLHAGRWIACSGVSTTGWRPGTSLRIGSPTGTSLAGPRQNRATRAASRKPGGTTPRRPQRSKRSG